MKENVFSVLGNLLPAKEVGLTQKPISISLDESPRLHYAYRFARNKEPFIVTSQTGALILNSKDLKGFQQKLPAIGDLTRR